MTTAAASSKIATVCHCRGQFGPEGQSTTTFISGDTASWPCSTGAAWAVGYTESSDFPVMSAYQGNFGGGQDAVVVKLSPSGTLVFSTYLGGPGSDLAVSVAVGVAVGVRGAPAPVAAAVERKRRRERPRAELREILIVMQAS